MTDRYVVIGNPIAHSKSPSIHADFALQTGVDLQYCRLLSPLDGFEQTLRMLKAAGVKGANVTVPFKQLAHDLADHRSEDVIFAQAANTLCWKADGLHAQNTDGVGLCTDLNRLLAPLGLSLHGSNVLLLGAGGAASGCVAAFKAEGVAKLKILNRTPEKAVLLAKRAQSLGLDASGQALTETPSDRTNWIVVNASSSSLGGQSMPLHAEWFAQAHLVYDMMYGAAPTPFIQQALAANPAVLTSDGLGMLVFQAAAAFEWWTGRQPDGWSTLQRMRSTLAMKQG